MTVVVRTRRQLLLRASAALGSLFLAGCDRLAGAPSVRRLLAGAEDLTYAGQRLLVGDRALAREFSETDISPVFRSNGTSQPDSDTYRRLQASNFKDWALAVGGLVERPLSLSLDALRKFASRTQITRHDCVEGWSAIGKWTGVPLGIVLELAQVKPTARYVVFYCADELEQNEGSYYESIDLVAPRRQRRAVATSRRATARVQAGQIPHANRSRGSARFASRRQRRLLGGPGLRMVRRDLKERGRLGSRRLRETARTSQYGTTIILSLEDDPGVFRPLVRSAPSPALRRRGPER